MTQAFISPHLPAPEEECVPPKSARWTSELTEEPLWQLERLTEELPKI